MYTWKLPCDRLGILSISSILPQILPQTSSQTTPRYPNPPSPPPKVEFTGAQLQGATFRGATLDAVNFAECDLDGADFTGATIVSAEFGNARGRAIGLPAGVSKSMATRG